MSLFVKKVKSKGKIYHYLMEKTESGVKKIRVLTPDEVEKYEKGEFLQQKVNEPTEKAPLQKEEEKIVGIGNLFNVEENPAISIEEKDVFEVEDRGAWVELKEKASGKTYLLLVTQNRVYCGRCGTTTCKHAAFVAEYKKQA
jgi:ribosomal protein S27AE